MGSIDTFLVVPIEWKVLKKYRYFLVDSIEWKVSKKSIETFLISIKRKVSIIQSIDTCV